MHEGENTVGGVEIRDRGRLGSGQSPFLTGGTLGIRNHFGGRLQKLISSRHRMHGI